MVGSSSATPYRHVQVLLHLHVPVHPTTLMKRYGKVQSIRRQHYTRWSSDRVSMRTLLLATPF